MDSLSLPTLTLNPGSGIDFDFLPGVNDTISVTSAGGLTLSTTSLNLYQAGGTTPFTDNGTYTLLDYNTSFTGSLFGAFSVANSQPGKVYSIANNVGATSIDLTIGDAVSTQWAVDGGGSWNVAANWTAGVPNSIGAVATFGSILTQPTATITLDGAKTVGNLIFNNANTYAITGAAADVLTINNGIGAPLISVIAGNHSIAAPVVLLNPTNINTDIATSLAIAGNISGAGSITKLGTGTLVLSGSNTYSGATLIAAGTLEAAGSAALNGTPSITQRDATTLRVSGGTTSFAGPVTLDLFGGTATGISGLENGTANFAIDVTSGATLAIAGLFSNASGSFVKTGAGSLTLTNASGNTLANFGTGISMSLQNGTLNLNGGAAASYSVVGEMVVGDNTPNQVTLNLSGGTLSATTFFSIARGNGSSALTTGVNVTGGTISAPTITMGFANGVANYFTFPYLNISGSGTVSATNTVRLGESFGSNATVSLADTATLFAQFDLVIGNGGRSVVKAGIGTTVNANQLFAGTNSGGSGALWNRGTFILRSGASTNHFALGNAGNTSYGYYLHDTPVATTLQEIGVGGAGGGNGVLEVRSGTLNIAQWITLNRSNSGTGPNAMLLVAGGTIVPNNLAGRFYTANNGAAPNYTVIDVGTSGVIAGGPLANIDLNRTANTGHIANLTIHGGGIVQTPQIFAAQADGSANISFDNGTLRASAAGTLIGANIDSVTIYAGGATIDTNGFDVALGANPLLAPVGNGLATIALIAGGGGYIGRPVVNITDPTGTGATAVANFNETTGELVGISVTSPGSNYTSPTANLVGGGAFAPATLSAIVMDITPTTGGLNKIGAGTLTLSAASTYGGTTTVSAGTLLVANTAGSATGTGAVAVSAAGTLGGTGIITGSVTTASGSTLAPGGGVLGNLTVGGLNLSAGSIINQQITDPLTLDRIIVTGTGGLTINGGGYNILTAANAPFSTNGVYNLIDYDGTIGGTGTSALSVLNPQPNKTYTFGSNGDFVTLTISTVGGVPNFWNVDANGNWSVGANWTLNSPPNGVSAIANFGGGGTPITAPRTVTVDAPQTVGTIAFNSAVAFTISGTSALTLNNGLDPDAQITVTLGNHTIGAPLAAVSTGTVVNVLNPTDSLTITSEITGTTNLSKIGTGLLTLSGPNAINGTITINNGILESTATGALNATGGVTLASGTTLRLSGAGNTTAAPVILAIGAAAPISINVGVPDAPANFQFNTPAGATATISGLVTNASGSLVKTGPGSLTLTNNGDNTLGTVGGTSLSVRDGTLVLNSAGSFTSTGELVIGDATPNPDVTLTLVNGTLNVPSFISVGRGTGTTGLTQTFNVQGGTVNVQNLFTGFAAGVVGFSVRPNINISGGAVNVSATTRISESPGAISTMTLSGTASLDTATNTQIGWGGVATVNLSGTATMSTGGLALGSGSNVAGNNGAGALNQSGGTFTEHGGGAGDWRIGGYEANDAAAYGSLVLSGGTFSSGGRNIQIGANGTGVMDIRGGSYTSTGGFPVVGRFVGANGLLNISSGSYTKANAGNLLIIGEQGIGVVNITGGSLSVNSPAGGAGSGGGTGGIRLGHTTTGVGTINLRGGTLTTTGIAKSADAGVANIYFSGGTLIAGATNATFLQGLNSAIVGPGGATVDTNGNNITIAQILEAPQGQGIVTIPVLTGGSGYIGQPIVQINGGGTGATAVANVVSGAVTSITITNPGNNFASLPTISLIGGGATTPATTDDANIVLGNNATTGGLTKTGTGTLTLTAANTYGGPSAVNAGTLLAANASGSATGTGPVTVGAAGTLGGLGIINGAVTVNGTIRPGQGANRTLTLDNGLALASGGRLYVDIADASLQGAPSTGASTLGAPFPTTNNFLNILGGTTSINSAALFTVDGTGLIFADGQYSYQIASGAGDQSALNITTAGQFTVVGIPNATNLSLTGNGTGAVFLNFSTVVPEPMLLLPVAAAAAWLIRRRRSQLAA